MAQGDWGANASIRPTVVHLQVGSDGINHVGVSYEVVASDGRTLQTHAYTWTPPPTHAAALVAAAHALFADLSDKEGIAVRLASFPHMPAVG